jgi:hypothetical protein
LNIDVDPEDWREDLAKDVPVARREGNINAWDVNDNFDNELPPQGRISSFCKSSLFLF